MKRVILMLVAVLMMGTGISAKQRVVYKTDSINKERLVIEVNDTMRNGQAEVDTLSITRYPLGTSGSSVSRRNSNDEDLEDLKEVMETIGWKGSSWGGAIAMFTIFMVIFGIFILPLLIIALIIYFRHKNRKAKYELAAKMIEKGEPLPADLEESVRGLSDMEARGIKNMCIGAALTVFFWALTDSFGLACIGLIVLANGLSQYIIARRTKDTKDETDLKKLKEELETLKKQQAQNDIETVDVEEVNL